MNQRTTLRKDDQAVQPRYLNHLQTQRLQNQLKILNHTCKDKHNELIDMTSKLRYEGLKNQKIKKEVMEIEEKMQQFARKQADQLLLKFKDNKSSPLFYNEAGLSPFQLVKIGQSKYQQSGQNHICMICYCDLQKGVKIMRLPCCHILHKECGIQHLLCSRQCPACSQEIK